ncbi:MAG: APC family permease [Streptosporangiaceae bacterium]|nr:APC family permease [Streptosporangiaceae bacterium]
MHQTPGLHRDAVGLVQVLFQSIANMAPGAAVAFSILFAAPYAGGATPLSVLIGLGLCLLVAITIGQLAKHLPSAGGLYTYNARGLGNGFGFMVGWAFLLAEVVAAPGGLLILGIVVSSVLHSHLGWPTWTWAPFAAAAGLLVWFLVWRGIKMSTAASVTLGVFELAVFLALAISLITHAGPHNTAAVFTVHHHNAKGLGSVIPGVLYAVFGMIGFEAAAPLGEEARNPRRTIPRAVFFSCLAIGIFYLICYYAATVFFGPAKMTGFINVNGGDPWPALATAVWGLGFIAVTIALVNSAIAGANASAVATTRVGYALGRIRMLPRVMARVHPRLGTPSVATHVQMLLAIGYALGVGFAFGAPLKALVFQGTISTILIVAIYMATGLSCIVYYLRERRAEFNPLLHGLIPLATFVLFIPVLLAAFGVDFAGLGITALAFPANDAPYVIYGWLAAGIVVLIYFFVTDRERIARTGLVFEETQAVTPPSDVPEATARSQPRR